MAAPSETRERIRTVVLTTLSERDVEDLCATECRWCANELGEGDVALVGYDRIRANPEARGIVVASVYCSSPCARGDNALLTEAALLDDQRTAALAIDPADHATTSRDYGRGYAQAIKDVRAALGAGS